MGKTQFLKNYNYLYFTEKGVRISNSAYDTILCFDLWGEGGVTVSFVKSYFVPWRARKYFFFFFLIAYIRQNFTFYLRMWI